MKSDDVSKKRIKNNSIYIYKPDSEVQVNPADEEKIQKPSADIRGVQGFQTDMQRAVLQQPSKPMKIGHTKESPIGK